MQMTHVSNLDEKELQDLSPRSMVSDTSQTSLFHNDSVSTLILLDWDDTLFPTSMVCSILENVDKNGLALICDEQIALLNKLGALTLTLLSELIAKYGSNNIHIVTNSLEGWIKDSLCYASCIADVYKDIQKLLKDCDITMDSAQSLYSKQVKIEDNACAPTVWKRLCFDRILNGNKEYFHVISIGDQWTDHHSVKESIDLLKHYVPTHHMIKLKGEPNLMDMIHQMMYIQTCFDQIFDVISRPNTVYFANPKSIQPVVIDYYEEEMKLNVQYHYNECLNNMNISE